MKKVVKALSTAGSVALILSGTAWADPPVSDGYGKWSVNSSGNIVFSYPGNGGATCPSGFTCSTPTSGAGFAQRQITDGSGNRYFQTVITPDDARSQTSAQVSFADETFVKVGTTGISGSQRASDSSVSGSTTSDFSTTTFLNTGWAAGDPTISTYKHLEILQVETETNNKGTVSAEVSLYNAFTYKQNGSNTSPTGKSMDVNQSVLITPGSTLGSNADDDVQKFVMRQASGDLNGAAHALNSPVLLPGTSPSDVAWSTTDDVKVIYLGQQMVNSEVEAFRYQFYQNLTSGADAIKNFEVGQSAPWSWVNPFGSSPTMTVP